MSDKSDFWRWFYAGLAGLLFLGGAPLKAMADPPVITAINIQGAVLRLDFATVSGATNSIETCSVLGGSNWLTLTNLVATDAHGVFSGPLPAGARQFYRVRQVGLSSSSTPPGMVLIPRGSFQMGDEFNEGAGWEVPVHSVYVSPVFMDKYEVTKGLWDQVLAWALTNGYSFDNLGSGKAPTHPVQSINWFDMVKWCNARSESEGRKPAYYADSGLTQVYKTGQRAPAVDWSAGYRLPTEAEWEKASRGGVDGHRFPWSDVDTISHAQANYFSDPSFAYDISPTRGFNPAFDDGVMPFTSPVGSFAPNGYGLYDTAGNVWEWCWDYAGPYSSDPQTDPQGPLGGDTRVGRGGNWNYYAEHCRNGYRYGNPPNYSATNIGFRCAMSAPKQAQGGRN